MPETSTYRSLNSRQHSTDATAASAAQHQAVQRSSHSGNDPGSGQRAATGYTALAAGQGCGADQGQDLLAGTANGRARWIDVERGQLKADMTCRPAGTAQVKLAHTIVTQLLKHCSRFWIINELLLLSERQSQGLSACCKTSWTAIGSSATVGYECTSKAKTGQVKATVCVD